MEEVKEEVKEPKKQFNAYEEYGKLIIERKIIDTKILELEKLISNNLNRRDINGR